MRATRVRYLLTMKLRYLRLWPRCAARWEQQWDAECMTRTLHCLVASLFLGLSTIFLEKADVLLVVRRFTTCSAAAVRRTDLSVLLLLSRPLSGRASSKSVHIELSLVLTVRAFLTLNPSLPLPTIHQEYLGRYHGTPTGHRPCPSRRRHVLRRLQAGATTALFDCRYASAISASDFV